MKHCDNGENMRTCRSEESYLSDKCLTLRGYDGGVQKAHVPPKLPRHRVGCTAVQAISMSSSNCLFTRNSMVISILQ
jgi:hypothetical protein